MWLNLSEVDIDLADMVRPVAVWLICYRRVADMVCGWYDWLPKKLFTVYAILVCSICMCVCMCVCYLLHKHMLPGSFKFRKKISNMESNISSRIAQVRFSLSPSFSRLNFLHFIWFANIFVNDERWSKITIVIKQKVISGLSIDIYIYIKLLLEGNTIWKESKCNVHLYLQSNTIGTIHNFSALKKAIFHVTSLSPWLYTINKKCVRSFRL